MKHTMSASCSMAPRLAKVAQLGTLSVDALTVFHPTVQLAQRNNRNIQFLRQPLQRTRNGTHLFLTASVRHAAGVHQLKVVDDNHLHIVLTHQTACLCAEFEHRERRRVIHIKRRIIQFPLSYSRAAPIRKAPAGRS